MKTNHSPDTPRLVSLDAYRGAIMLLMASSGLGLAQLAKAKGGNPPWGFLGGQVEHAAWVGWTLWDFIQPAFMFMVGVALPWSVASRQARGQSFPTMLGHALWRSLALVLLAVFLTSAWSKSTQWVFTNVLAQIGLGYPFLFLLYHAKPRTQWLAAFGILIVYWGAFALYPLPTTTIPDGTGLTGFSAHWEKNANLATAFDRWFLNLFPRETPFLSNEGGYHTLNFVPSLATMIFGMIAGRLLRGDGSITRKLSWLIGAGLAGIVLGEAIEIAGLCPIIKRIWTPSWAIFSAGVVTIMLAGFVAVIDWQGWRRWAFPLVVAGMNPIALYCMWQLMAGFVRENVKRHLGQQVFESLGAIYVPMLERGVVLLVFWLVLLWMHRKKIWIRI